eukprot:2183901-Prymnesium_polylepis.1
MRARLSDPCTGGARAVCDPDPQPLVTAHHAIPPPCTPVVLTACDPLSSCGAHRAIPCTLPRGARSARRAACVVAQRWPR